MSTGTEFSFQLLDVDCSCDASAIEAIVQDLEGVQSCVCNPITGRLTIVGNISPPDLYARVEGLGYQIEQKGDLPMNRTEGEEPSFFQFIWRGKETRLALLGAFLILPGLIFGELLGWSHWLINLASIGALITAGAPIARSAWRSLQVKRDININSLMTIASIGAVFIGAYTEAGMVMVLFALGEALESYVGGKARASIRSLMEVVPQNAIMLQEVDDEVRELSVPVDSLQLGDVIRVKPGERIPMDGRVVAGVSSVNQAPITGESRLLRKEEGSAVYASSINGEGSLEIEVTHLARDNTISRVIQMVEEAQEKRAPAQRFVDRFARIYTPAVVLLAVLVATIPPLVFNQPFLNPPNGSFGWLYRGLALLVVACPCALVISTPVSLISAISNAARKGVLIKGGAFIETLRRVEVVALDKTGTITLGTPTVVKVRSIACSSTEMNTSQHSPSERCEACDDLIALASSIERQSSHPLADAIVREADRRGVLERYPHATLVTTEAGRGVSGQVNGRNVMIASHSHFDEAVPHPEEDCLDVREEEGKGSTTVLVSEEDQFLGSILLTDRVRESSHEAVRLLEGLGLRSIVMLTGDNPTSAKIIGDQIGISDVRSELLPEEKVAAVANLQETIGVVAMVGDGINDAPALAAADVGIAIGAASSTTTQAMETADIALMSDDLRRLPFVLRLSRSAMRVIQFNIGLSIAIKIAFLILVLLGLGTMWMAVLADMGTSLMVTLNGMRLLRYPRGNHPLT